MASSIQTGNPYRAVLRREYPEPLIALLSFILGIWLWDHYFGEKQGYAPGTEKIALVKIDRDLRLADAMEQDPAWLKWLVGVDSPVVARRDALETFEKLGGDEALSARGLEAHAVVWSEQSQLPLGTTLGRVRQGETVSSHREIFDDLVNHRGTWWHAKRMAFREESGGDTTEWEQIYTEENSRLRIRTVAVRMAVWVLGLIGLVFVPATLVLLKRGLHVKPRGYGGAWPLSMGLVVFLVATLAWIGFNLALEVGIISLPGLHPAMAIFLDSAARVMPALIALGLIFRHPGHVLRVMGLNRMPGIRPILGTFSLLMIADQLLRKLMNHNGSGDPGGGLSLSEAGWWGLAFAMIASCLLAPLSEEILYRGVLFRAFRNRIGVMAGALLSSLVFASLHFYNGYGLVSVAIFGFTCALLYSATGLLTSAIVLHMLYNLSIKLPEWIVYHAPLG